MKVQIPQNKSLKNLSNYLTRLPLPVCGLMLAFATLGNLVQSYGNLYCYSIGTIAFALYIIITIRILSNIQLFKSEMNNHIIASVFPTYSMATMVLSTYFASHSMLVSRVVWFYGFILHILLVLFYTIKHAKPQRLNVVYPSWFIVYVGIGAAAITGKPHSPFLSRLSLIVAFVSLILTIIIVVIRLRADSHFPEATLPLQVVYASPLSLCLTGYMKEVDDKKLFFVILLVVVAQSAYFFGVYKVIHLHTKRLPFYPSYSAFTFPLVISPFGLKLATNYLNRNKNTTWLPYLVHLEEFMAIIIVSYVVCRYIIYLNNLRKITLESE